MRRGSPEAPTTVNSLAQPAMPTETKSMPMKTLMDVRAAIGIFGPQVS
jgi:hypothetical protein